MTISIIISRKQNKKWTFVWVCIRFDLIWSWLSRICWPTSTRCTFSWQRRRRSTFNNRIRRFHLWPPGATKTEQGLFRKPIYVSKYKWKYSYCPLASSCASVADHLHLKSKTNECPCLQPVLLHLVFVFSFWYCCWQGEMIHVPENGLMLFLGSPSVLNLEDLTRCDKLNWWLVAINQLRWYSWRYRRGLYLSDIPLHDATRDLVLLSEQFEAEYKLTRDLEMLTDQLQQTKVELEREKQKTDTWDNDTIDTTTSRLKSTCFLTCQVTVFGSTSFCGQRIASRTSSCCPPLRNGDSPLQRHRRFQVYSHHLILFKKKWVNLNTNALVICALAIRMPTESWKSCGCSTFSTRHLTYWLTQGKIPTFTRCLFIMSLGCSGSSYVQIIKRESKKCILGNAKRTGGATRTVTSL